MRDLLQFAVKDGEVPAVGSLPPVAVVLAARFAVEADVAGNIAAGFFRALLPCAHIVEHPGAILLVAGEHEGVQSQDRGGEVERVVADAIEILVAVRQHLLVVGLKVEQFAAPGGIVQQMEGARYRVADPIIGGRFAHHGTFAAGPDTLEYLVDGS